jgi:DNA-binding Lrp family transcriptional regulator
VSELDAVDRALLGWMQVTVPLVPQPFAALGRATGLAEDEVLARVRRLVEDGTIRQIGAILDTRRLGYNSTLAAFHVGDESLEAVAGRISAHPGVSHNYGRVHHYDLWFTLAVPSGRDAEAEVRRLAGETGVDDWLYLPALRVFKLRTFFRLQDGHLGQDNPAGSAADSGPSPAREPVPADVPYLRALQDELPLVPRPFAAIAHGHALDEGELLVRAQELQAAGIVRRYCAVLRHRRAGYRANGMACWVVPEADIEAAGRLAARCPEVSHCYQRPAYPPHWPYTLFTMIHGRNRAEVEVVVVELAEALGIDRFEVLYSTREFKKERVRYFEEAA